MGKNKSFKDIYESLESYFSDDMMKFDDMRAKHVPEGSPLTIFSDPAEMELLKWGLSKYDAQWKDKETEYPDW